MKLVLFLWKKPGDTRIYTSTAPPTMQRWKALKSEGYLYYQLNVEVPDLTEIKPDAILHTKAEEIDLPVVLETKIAYNGKIATVTKVTDKFVDVRWEKDNSTGTLSLDAFREKLLNGTFIRVR